jgi:hypothetical protein
MGVFVMGTGRLQHLLLQLPQDAIDDAAHPSVAGNDDAAFFLDGIGLSLGPATERGATQRLKTMNSTGLMAMPASRKRKMRNR